MTTPSGTAIGSLVVEERIASGAQGELYRARQPGLDRTILLRKLRRELLQSRELVDRLRREARLSARVQHRGIVQIFDFFAERGDHYLVLEYVDGPDLKSVLERTGQIPPRIVALIGLEIAGALAELHRRGIIHCELRPEVLCVSRWGDVKLSGLGGARELGEENGLPVSEIDAFTAPEVAQGEYIDTRADIYSLGAILFTLLTGESPTQERAALRGIPRRLAKLVRRCLEQSPDARPKIEQVISQLEHSVKLRRAGDGRVEITAWLWEVRVLRPQTPEVYETEPTEPIPEQAPRRLPRFALPTAIAAILLGFTIIQLSSRETIETPEQPQTRPLPPVAAAPPAKPALVRFVAHPWAEIQVDDGPAFYTPRAESVALPPGRHQVVFRHPTFGEKKRVLVVDAGEEKTVRHAFEAVSLQ